MIEVIGYNKFSTNRETKCIPLIEPDGIGPWTIKYSWIKNQSPEFLKNYHTPGSTKSNVRRSTHHLAEHWIPHNALIVNQGHLGNIVWRIKAVNEYNDSIDMIEVWRSGAIIEDLFAFENKDLVIIEQATVHNPAVTKAGILLEDGGTGLKNGSGLTIDDAESPMFFTKNNAESLMQGMWDAGFEIRYWTTYPKISKQRAIDIFHELKNKAGISINVGWNSNLNPL